MKVRPQHRTQSEGANRRRTTAGLTLTELIVALGVGSFLLTAAATLSVYGARTFAAIGSYADLDAKGRNALDVLSWKVRGASAVLACETNLPVKSLTLTNSTAHTIIKLAWDSDSRTFVLDETGQPTRTLWTECDGWDFALYNRAPNVSSTNMAFNPAATLSDCRLIDMSWKCSRTMPGQKVNVETVQTTQVVLRNKP
jgi:hypothetical protein